jgi:hypothetical protein
MKIKSKVTKIEKIVVTLNREELCVAYDVFAKLVEHLNMCMPGPSVFTKMEHSFMHMFYKNLEKVRFRLNEQETDTENN